MNKCDEATLRAEARHASESRYNVPGAGGRRFFVSGFTFLRGCGLVVGRAITLLYDMLIPSAENTVKCCRWAPVAMRERIAEPWTYRSSLSFLALCR